MDLKGKTAIVTGGSSGIGQSICLAAAEAGAKVIFTYNSTPQGARKTLRSINEAGGEAECYKVDLESEDSIKDFFKTIRPEHPNLDILVNNAGINRPRGLFETKDWQKIFQVDLFAPVIVSGLAAEMMKRGGRILNITSIYGFGYAAAPKLAPYGAAKAALNHYTQTLAKNLAPDILVNAVAPGYVKTPLWGDKSESEFEESGKEQLIGRMIEPSEIADIALAVIRNDAMTGEIVIADGGLSLKSQ